MIYFVKLRFPAPLCKPGSGRKEKQHRSGGLGQLNRSTYQFTDSLFVDRVEYVHDRIDGALSSYIGAAPRLREEGVGCGEAEVPL